MKFLKIFLVAILITFSNSSHVFAAEEFNTSFDSTYNLSEDSTTRVTHNISIKNNLANIYLTKYTLSLGAESISDLSAKTGNTKLPTTIQENSGNTTIILTIPTPVIGKDQTLDLKVSYTTDTIAQKYLNNWEINIPKVNKANEFSSYKRTVILPSGTSQPSVTIPRPSSVNSDDSRIILNYLGFPSDNISILIGDSLTYKLELAYFISNPTSSLVDTEIALPPDTEYQSVLLNSIEPSPKVINTDQDGNWLAVYSLKPNEISHIKTTVFVTVYPNTKLKIPHDSSPKLILGNKYWDIDSQIVKSLQERLKTPEIIYDYLVENFSYNFEKIGVNNERLGVSKSLENPNNVICTEFTDSFIALARAKGIPSREINGIAYTTGSNLVEGDFDLLHAWPEFYNENLNSWQQVDPTLGNTTGGLDYFNKLDFGHITFVKHGIEPDYPYPAGSYKQSSQDKTIHVTLVSSAPDINKDTYIEEINDKYHLKNNGNSAIINEEIKFPNGSSQTITYLPPLGEQEFSVLEKPKNSFFLSKIFGKLFQSVKNIFAR